MEPAFSISESLRFGWGKLREHSGLVLKLVLILLILGIADGILARLMLHSYIEGIFRFIVSIGEAVWGVGMSYIVLKLSRGEPAAFREIVPAWMMFWRTILSSLLVGLLILAAIVFYWVIRAAAAPLGAAGVFLTVITGIGAAIFAIWIIVRYGMIKYLPVDPTQTSPDRLGIIDVLRRSVVLTDGVKWRLAIFVLVIILLNLAGAIVFLVGLLISIPVSMFASAYVYLKLLARADAAASAPTSSKPPAVPAAVE